MGQPRAERRKETVGGDAAAVKALVVLGCMQVQKGTFLDSAAMDVLLGLGSEEVKPEAMHSHRVMVQTLHSTHMP